MSIVSATVKLTLRCNDHCEFCYQHQHSHEELSLSQVESMINSLWQAGCQVLMLSGGEPLLRDDIGGIIRYANRMGMITRLATNGLLVERQMLHDLRDNGLNELYISLGDMTDYKKLVALQTLMKELKGMEFRQLSLGVNIIASKTFVRQIHDCINWLHQVGISLIFMIPPKPSIEDSWFRQEKLQPADYILLYKAMSHWREKMSFIKDCALRFHNQAEEVQMSSSLDEWECPAISKGITVTSTGMVYPCGYFEHEVYSAGNMVQTGLTELLHSEGFKQFAMLKSQSGLVPPCLNTLSTPGGA